MRDLLSWIYWKLKIGWRCGVQHVSQKPGQCGYTVEKVWRNNRTGQLRTEFVHIGELPGGQQQMPFENERRPEPPPPPPTKRVAG